MKALFYILLALFICPFNAQSTSVQKFAFDGLCETAKTIVHVRCIQKESLKDSDREGIFTKYYFDVIEVVKGNAQGKLELMLPGGQVENMRTEIPGMPQFVLGQETVLFLSEEDANGSPWPVGLGQGCYGVSVGEDGKRQVRLGAQNPTDPTMRSKPGIKKSVGLQLFMDQIRGVLKTETPSARPTQ